MMTSTHARATVPAFWLWFAALALAVCETWLNFGARPGLNWGLSTAAASALFTFFLWQAGKPLSWQRLLPLLLACLLAAGAAITASPIMDGLIFIGLVATLAVAILMVDLARIAEQLGAKKLLRAPALTGLSVLTETGKRIGEAASYARTRERVPILRGVTIAVPVTLVFGLLLTNADPILAYWRDSALRALQALAFIPRTICFLVLAMLLLGSFGKALAAPATDAGTLPDAIDDNPLLGEIEHLIILCAIVALFTLFLLLQLSHLLGVAAAVPGSGITYAQSAHQGFGELTIVASLCTALLIALTKCSNSGARPATVRALSITLIAQTQLLLASAYHRIDVYEAAYGFTELRLYVQCYAVLIFAALTMLGWEVWRAPDFRRLARRVAVLAILAIAGLVYWNNAAWIVDRNMARYERTGALDLRYLAIDLGPDAVPELTHAFPRLAPAQQAWLRSCLTGIYRSSHGAAFTHDSWYEWSARRTALDSALTRPGIVLSHDASAQATIPCGRCPT